MACSFLKVSALLCSFEEEFLSEETMQSTLRQLLMSLQEYKQSLLHTSQDIKELFFYLFFLLFLVHFFIIKRFIDRNIIPLYFFICNYLFA